MNKTNQFLAISLILLLSIGGYFYFFQSEKTSLEGYDFDFSVQDTAQVGKIMIADKSLQRVVLERKNALWVVGERGYRARPDAVKNLLETLQRIELQYRLPRAAVPTVIKDIAENGLKVEVYDRKNKKIKCFYIGGVNQDETGTNAIMENSEEPYVVGMKGFIGSLRSRFFTDLEAWRDRAVFQMLVDDIALVSIEYPLQQSKSFQILRKNREKYEVLPFYNTQPRIIRPVNKGYVTAFLMGFQSQIAEGFENQYLQRDSIRQTIPFACITLISQQKDTQSLKLFPILPLTAQGNVQLSNSEVVIERYFGDTKNKDFLLLQHQNMEKILWAYPAFFQ